MNVVILGCGRSGSMLAIQMSRLGHQVTLIERNPESLRRLGKDYPCKIVIGDGLDQSILAKAGIESADAFLAMTRGDNTNLMAAQIVKQKFNTAKLVVKVADPMRAEAYRKMGLFCINASALITGMCRDWLQGSEFQPIDQYNFVMDEEIGF